MSKSTKLKKIAIIFVCAAVIVVGGYFCARAYMGANADQVDNSDKKEYVNEYIDYEYEGPALINIDSKSVQDIIGCYEKDDLSLTVNEDKSMTYKIDNNLKNNVVSVEAAVCLEKKYDSDAGEAESALLYLGSNDSVEYDKKTGNISSTYDYKGLVLNETIPLATYQVSKSDKEVVYRTPVYLNDNEAYTMLEVVVDAEGKVTVKGEYVDKDEEGNKLPEGKIVELKNGTTIWPAYENFIVKQATIDATYVEATETYDEEKSYVYGTDFNLSYTDIPDGKYLYNYKVEYSSDSADSSQESKPEYCLYTEQKEIDVKEDKVVQAKEVNLEDIDKEDFKKLGVFKFLGYVKKHRDNVTSEDIKQMYEHHIDSTDVLKGYISTWNSLDINRAMRTGKIDSLDEDDKKTIDVLTKNCMNNTFDDNVLAVRNVSADFLTSIFGTKYKGENLSDSMLRKGGDKLCLELEKQLQEEIVGKKISEKGFMSVSLVPTANIMFVRKVRLLVMIPKGTRGYVTHNVVESEAILPPNSNLVIKEVTYNTFKNRYEVYCLAEQNF